MADFAMAKPAIGSTKADDPLDKLMYMLGVIAGISGAAAYVGYGKPVAAVLSVLGTVAYFKAPRRSFPTSEVVTDGVDLTGKVAIVTGPTSGIGTDTARVLALRGAHVILAARSKQKLAETQADLEKSLAKQGCKGKFTSLVLELSDLKSVEGFVENFKALKLPLHLLINNAGIMAVPSRQPTKQGLESQVGTNHVAHFHLTMLLTDLLKASSSASFRSRVICLSSTGFRFAQPHFFSKANKDLETEPYDEWTAYGNAKLSNMLFAREYHERHASQGVDAASVMPGGIHTGLQGHVDLWTAIKWRVVTPFFFKSIEQGSATTLFAALKAELEKEGAYFENCKATGIAATMPDEACKWLWAATEEKIKSLRLS